MIFIRVSMLAMVVLTLAGGVALIVAIVNERRMQRHRQPGVSYWDVTLRRDGAWRRADLFTEAGLVYQGRAANWNRLPGCGVTGEDSAQL